MAQAISKMETTAVEWLEKKFYVRGPIGHEMPDWLKELFEQAKAMEKEQIMNAYGQGYVNAQNYEEIGTEQYYNETYGG